VNRDIPPVISLEVTVPSIVLPTMGEDVEASEATNEERSSQEREQVHLLPLDREGLQRPAREQGEPILQGEKLTYTTREGLFGLFRIKAVAAQGQLYLLQVLRQGRQSEQKQRRIGEGASQMGVTDALVFTISYTSTDDISSSTSPRALTPGLNRVEITLDEESIPVSYSIDGAEG
jgi:hypothetical protein